MKRQKTIFLSYRRDDNPGYVRQLQQDLQRVFGKDSVFRDVEDIAGGASWKKVLEDNLADSAALIVVIGSRWEQIWNERKDKSSDYLVYELNYANDHGIPVIPVTVAGAALSSEITLGPLSWLLDKQFYDISDKQRRWSTDVDGLVALLQQLPGLGSVTQTNVSTTTTKKRWTWIAPVALVVAVGFLIYEYPDFFKKPNGGIEMSGGVPNGLKHEPSDTPSDTPSVVPDEQYPDVSGSWLADDGDVIQFGPVINGRFVVRYLDAEGEGSYIADMPRKFQIEIAGIGKGEYEYSNDNVTIVGKFLRSGAYEPERKKFVRQ